MFNMSSAEGQRFAQIANEVTEKIRALGPNPVKGRKPGSESPCEPALSGNNSK